MKHFVSIAGVAVTCSNFLILSTAIICSYEAVRLPGIQSVVLGLIALNWVGMWIVFVSLFASINAGSIKFLEKAEECVANMPCGRERMALRKELKSVRKLRVCMNWSFHYDKQHVVTTIGFIVTQMANMILTF